MTYLSGAGTRRSSLVAIQAKWLIATSTPLLSFCYLSVLTFWLPIAVGKKCSVLYSDRKPIPFLFYFVLLIGKTHQLARSAHCQRTEHPSPCGRITIMHLLMLFRASEWLLRTSMRARIQLHP